MDAGEVQRLGRYSHGGAPLLVEAGHVFRYERRANDSGWSVEQTGVLGVWPSLRCGGHGPSSVVIGNDSDRHYARWLATLLPRGVCASGTMDAWTW